MTTVEGPATDRLDHRLLFQLDQGAVGCPYPIFERLRREAPVVWVEEIESFVVTRYEDVAHVLDFVRAFAVPLPLSVIADRLGVPRSDMADFKRWSDDFTVAIGNHQLGPDELASMLVSQAQFFEYFEAMVHEPRIGIEVLLRKLERVGIDQRNSFLYESSYALRGLRQLWLTYRRSA